MGVKLMRIPGLVDLQVNGYKGVDFSDIGLDEETCVSGCRAMIETGTTAFLPTLITSPQEVYAHNLPIIAQVMDRPEFKDRLLGIHIEGPFLSCEDGARGAHDAEWIKAPDTDFLDQLIAWGQGKIKLLTLAADLEGAADLARHATRCGITVSLGHQMATEQHLQTLASAGATALTHLGNGIPAQLPRHENTLWAGLAQDELAATIIADGHHLPTAVLKTIIRAKGPERCIIISDASPLAGLSPGNYESMGAEVVLEDNGLLHNPATGYMAGSSATMLDCVNHLAALDLVSTRELVAMAFDNPLRLIGVESGRIRELSNVQFDEQRRLFYQADDA
jgi:N-acetylglucosamine-6-phosphate deacetylase